MGVATNEEQANKKKKEKEEEKKNRVPYEKLRLSLRPSAAASILSFLCNGGVIGMNSGRRSNDPGGDTMTKVSEILVSLARCKIEAHVEIVRSELAKQLALLVKQ